MIDVPDFVRRSALADGAAGQAWLDSLPDRIAALERRWNIRMGQAFPGGSEAYVAGATTSEGTEAVVKIALPGRGRSEARVLMAAAGSGYVRLIDYDEENSALLLERLGSQLNELGMPLNEQIAIICVTLREAWLAPATRTGVISAVDKAEKLAAIVDSSWAALGRPCSELAVDTALRYARLRAEAFDPTAVVLSHGDAHAWNTLAVPNAPGNFKLIDPDGLIAEPAYDLSISMREWSAELLAGDPVALGRRRAAQLAELGGADEEAIWQWGLLERVSNGLLLLQIGMDRLGRECLAVADAWAGAT